MGKDIYIKFLEVRTKGLFVVVAWIGALLGPMFIIGEFGNFLSSRFLFGIFSSTVSIISLYKGLKGLQRRIYSDFIVYTVITVVIFLLSLYYLLDYPAVWLDRP